MDRRLNRRLIVKGLVGSMVAGAGPIAASDVMAQDATKVVYGDSLYPPTTCDRTPGPRWLFVMQPDPGPQVTTIQVTFNYATTVTATRAASARDRAVFRYNSLLDQVPTQLEAVVPADYEYTSFRTGSGPCDNEIQVPPTPVYTVSGTILQHGNGKPVAGATVCIAETGVCTTTDEGGYFVFTDLEDGTYTITSTADVYKPLTTTVTVAGSDVYVDLVQNRGGGRK